VPSLRGPRRRFPADCGAGVSGAVAAATAADTGVFDAVAVMEAALGVVGGLGAGRRPLVSASTEAGTATGRRSSSRPFLFFFFFFLLPLSLAPVTAALGPGVLGGMAGGAEAVDDALAGVGAATRSAGDGDGEGAGAARSAAALLAPGGRS
jgi:hypothetical protein